MELTAQQAKQVIEYFAQQAAEDAPADGEWYTELWISRFKASIAVERQIGAWWWEALVEAQMELQSFDRDPDAYLYQMGYKANHIERGYMRDNLQDEVSFAIDNCWNNSGS